MGQSMNRPVLPAAAACLCLCLFGASATADPEGEATMRRAEEAMKAVKSYRGTWQIKATVGEAGQVPMEMELLGASGGRHRLVTRATGRPTGAMATVIGASDITNVIISDGTTLYTTFESGKRYTRRPLAHGLDVVTAVILGHPFQPHITYALAGEGQIGDRPCQVVKVVRTEKPQAPGIEGPPGTEIYIDKVTFRPLRFCTTLTTPPSFVVGMPAGSRPKRQTLVSTISLVGEALDVAVVDTDFVFSPPPGATEMVTGQPPDPAKSKP